jgi:DNA replication protein DnaC
VTTPEVTDVKAALTTGLTELRLPTVRHCYEETARLAERETLSYERYLLQLVTRECEDRQRKRIERLLNQSRIPAEKALSNFSLKRLPPKVALITKTLLEGEFLDRCENVLAFGNPDPETLCVTSHISTEQILLFAPFPAVAV